MERKTILILGGGVGGQVAANTLASGSAGRHRIVVVDKQREFVFAPSFASEAPRISAGDCLRNQPDFPIIVLQGHSARRPDAMSWRHRL